MENTKIFGTDDPYVFGFWVYLMTDLVLFAVLFVSFGVLHQNTFGGPSGQKLFSLSNALIETLVLLTSSFTCTLGMLGVHLGKKKMSLFWFLITFALGVTFLILEFSEFATFVRGGNDWSRSGFLSSFFTLVGTHGLHISIGLLWMGVAMCRILFRPLMNKNISRIFRMALFWHFLDFVWIFIFTVVYGVGYLT